MEERSLRFKMEDEQIRAMLSDLVNHIDYDIYKSLFVPECREDSDEEVEAQIDELVKIVRTHMNQ